MSNSVLEKAKDDVFKREKIITEFEDLYERADFLFTHTGIAYQYTRKLIALQDNIKAKDPDALLAEKILNAYIIQSQHFLKSPNLIEEKAKEYAETNKIFEAKFHTSLLSEGECTKIFNTSLEKELKTSQLVLSKEIKNLTKREAKLFDRFYELLIEPISVPELKSDLNDNKNSFAARRKIISTWAKNKAEALQILNTFKNGKDYSILADELCKEDILKVVGKEKMPQIRF